MRMFLIKMGDGTWFCSFSPTRRVVTTASWTEAHLFPSEQEEDVRDIVNHNPGAQYYETTLTEPVLASTLGDWRLNHGRDTTPVGADTTSVGTGTVTPRAGASVRTMDLGASETGAEFSALERSILKYAVDNDGAVMPLGYMDFDSTVRLDDVVAACGHLESMNLLSSGGEPASSSTFYDITEKGIKAFH